MLSVKPLVVALVLGLASSMFAGCHDGHHYDRHHNFGRYPAYGYHGHHGHGDHWRHHDGYYERRDYGHGGHHDRYDASYRHGHRD